MNNRDAMVLAFQAAFDEWERRFRVAQEDGNEGPLTIKDRGAYFADLLDELATGRPWCAIGLDTTPPVVVS